MLDSPFFSDFFPETTTENITSTNYVTTVTDITGN